jgi:single-strand DNA-binding protein
VDEEAQDQPQYVQDQTNLANERHRTMSAHNTVVLMGRLTRDVEAKFLPDGKAITSFSIAVDGYSKDAPSNFIDCSAFGKAAELIAQYFTKGKPILINGSLKQDTWEDKATGAKRSKLTVAVDSFSFIPKNDGGNTGESAPAVTSRNGRDQDGQAKPAQATMKDIVNQDESEEPPF